jgi:DNA polymerase-1
MSQQGLFDLDFSQDHPKTHIIVDASNLFFRASTAYGRLDAKDVENPVSHIFGTVKLLSTIVRKVEGDHDLHIVRDGTSSFRYKVFPDYKKTRIAKKAERKAVQEDWEKEYFRKLWSEYYQTLRHLPTKWYREEDMEADDTIASLTHQLLEEDSTCRIWIMTSDQDLWSLISDRVSCIALESKFIDAASVYSKLGVSPCKVPLYKSFFGDSSDEYPGVYRLRKKVLCPLIESSDSVEEVYEKVEGDDFVGSSREKSALLDFVDQVKINNRIANLVVRDVGVVESHVGSESDMKSWLGTKRCPSLLKDLYLFY